MSVMTAPCVNVDVTAPRRRRGFVVVLRPLLSVCLSDSLQMNALLSAADFVVFPGSHVQLG